MAPYVGVSLETFTGIIGTILAGIALGTAVGGRLADRHPPERLIGPALVLGGVLAWASLPIVSFFGPDFGSGPVAIVALALLAFVAPAAVLSAVSPMVAKIRLTDLGQTGEVVGGLSAAGTVGALFGTFFTGFVLVSAAPTRPIVIGVGGLLAIWGIVLMAMQDRRKPDVALSVGGVLVLLLAITSSSPCEFESAYFCGAVVTDADDESVRYLILDDLRHAAVDLDDPTHLEFRYVRLLADVVDALPDGPLRVLHLGGGGFTMPRYIEAVRPGSTSLVLEIDETLVEVAEDQLGLVRGPSLQVEIGDARLALGDLDDGSFDLVIGDAFASLTVPWHLTTTEFVGEIARVLDDHGIYAMNAVDSGGSDFVRAELATLDEHFASLALVQPSDGAVAQPVNQVLVAGRSTLPTLDVDPDDGVLVPDLVDFIGDARVLTDDFAPVDRLTSNR